MKNPKLYVEKVYISVLLCAIAVSGCSKLHGTIPGMSNSEFPPMPDSEEWDVLRVSDGDTIVVRQTNGQEKKLRLCGVDSPEIRHNKQPGQPLGIEAKANLQRLVDEVEGTVMVTEVESDRYGRTVAEVFSSKNGIEKNFNSEQVLVGLAIVYPQYVKKCPNGDVFLKAEAIAQSGHLGVWSGNFEKPWDYRKRLRGN
ncbi:MAG: thermonuclease family protein [Nostoc sp.]|uniref:thermonuclease family protein n=1 Tax=Nostoc sp. TaxID=1180 RepID=UPI002FFA16FE